MIMYVLEPRYSDDTSLQDQCAWCELESRHRREVHLLQTEVTLFLAGFGITGVYRRKKAHTHHT